MVEAGVTAVADHYFYMDEAARAVEKAGTRALLGWAMFGTNGMEQIGETGDFVKRWQAAANGRIRTMMAPHSNYLCDQEFLRACARKAQELDVGIHIHLAETKEQTKASFERYGVTPIEYAKQAGVFEVPTIIAHACGATPEDIETLSRIQTGIAHAPKTYFKLAMGLAPVTEFRQAGIPVGLATDVAVSNNTLDILESLRLMAMGQKHRAGTPEVLTIADALTIATKESARVYGQPDDLGELAAGKLADIILLDMRGTHHQPLHRPAASLVYNARAGDVQTVIVDGQVIMRDRELLTIDKTEIVHHVRQRMQRLAQRVPEARIQTYDP
jgi:5-methylthioadenosine/S-adenosylhomocysteine deaminase